ncbi:MAG TPA: hypothetical protein VHM19_07630 [Polyangiales bacterium]|nr:hypothetical protein [Polyangiales bacterium]
MRFTVVVFRPDGQAARSLRLTAFELFGSIALGVGAFGGVLWLGWKIGELTARL